MANPVFLDITTQKGGKITDPSQVRVNYKNQLLVYSFDQSLEMATGYNNSHAGSTARPAPIKFTLAVGCYEAELKQACLTGDQVTAATFSFTTTDKLGEEKKAYTIKATNGIITKVKRLSPPLWLKENDNVPALVEVELTYEKLEEQDLIDNKQMSYNWADR
jgi:type VI secretion system Hcp family effector